MPTRATKPQHPSSGRISGFPLGSRAHRVCAAPGSGLRSVWGALRLVRGGGAWSRSVGTAHSSGDTRAHSSCVLTNILDNDTFIDYFPSCIVDFIYLDYLLTPRVSRSPSNPLSVTHCGAHRAIRARSGWHTACADCLARSGRAIHVVEGCHRSALST